VAAVCTVIAGSIVLFSVRNSPLLGGDTRMPANVAPATPSMSGH
jgi:hypothetical protein